MKQRWKADFLFYEGWSCVVAAAALVVVSECVIGPEGLNTYLDANRFLVFGPLATVLGALLGLVLTAAALLLDRIVEGKLAVVQKSVHATKLARTFKAAMWALGAATLLAVLLLVPMSSAVVDRILVYLWGLTAL